MKHITQSTKKAGGLFHIPYSIFHRETRGERGLGMIEIIVVIALIAASFVAILQLSFLERRSQDLAREDTAAYMLARETLEATRVIRDEDWANITSLNFDTPYYPILSSGVWEFSATNPGNINVIYTRWVEVSEVFRDGSDNIAPTGTSDIDTVLATSRVSWITAGGATRTIELEIYLTNWQTYK